LIRSSDFIIFAWQIGFARQFFEDDIR